MVPITPSLIPLISAIEIVDDPAVGSAVLVIEAVQMKVLARYHPLYVIMNCIPEVVGALIVEVVMAIMTGTVLMTPEDVLAGVVAPDDSKSIWSPVVIETNTH